MFNFHRKISLLIFNFSSKFYKKKSKIKGTPGFEPGTSRSAVECSTTELYPHAGFTGFVLYKSIFKTKSKRVQLRSAHDHRRLLHGALKQILCCQFRTLDGARELIYVVKIII